MLNSTAPIITTIIPTYKRPTLLRRAILSVLAQSGPALQVCVYDNASGDSTAGVVGRLAVQDPRVKYFCHASNIGGMANFQYGLARVTTPLFSFLSDDDVLLPGFYEQAAHDLDTCPEAAFWCGVTILMDPEGTVYTARLADWPKAGLYAPPDGILQMLRGSMPCWTSVLFRKIVIDKVGYLNEELQGPSDMEYLLRSAANNRFFVSKHASALLLLHPDSFSETASLKCFWPGWQGMIKSVKQMGTLGDQDRKTIEHGLRHKAQRMLFRRGAAALAKKDHAFSGEAASMLRMHFINDWRAIILGGLTSLCLKIPLFQFIYTKAYRFSEWLLLAKRVALRKKYGSLSRYL